jgi:hypothetical protein
MLASFQIKRQFNKLTVSLWIECEQEVASMIVTYDRRIVRTGDIEFWKVKTPEMAEGWLSAPQGELGNLVETLEWQARHERSSAD